MHRPFVRRQVRQRFSEKQDSTRLLQGVIGDGEGNVETGVQNRIYCRVGDQVVRAWAADVPRVYGLSVYLVNSLKYPGDLEVESGNANINTFINAYHNNVAPHGREHLWLGRDPVFVHLRQFLPFWIGPTGNPGTPYGIQIGRGVLWEDGNILEVPSQVVNLAQHVPQSDASGARYCRYVLMTINTAGEVVATPGATVTEASFSLAQIPAYPPGTSFVLGAVRLYSDQVGIAEARDGTDIIDMRYPYRHTHPAAETGGHDPVTVADTATVDLTLTGQQLSAAVIQAGLNPANMGSGAATNGQIPTADGAGRVAWATPVAALSVREADNTPNVSPVSAIIVPNGTLVDNGDGSVTLNFGSAATDGAAIHDNQAGEIAAVLEKLAMNTDDLLLIEDCVDANNKKSVRFSTLAKSVRLDDLMNVSAVSPADKYVLIFNATTQKWEALDQSALVFRDHTHDGGPGSGGTFDAGNLTSGIAFSGDVLTATGTGGVIWAPRQGITFREVDGTPNSANIDLVIVPNGTLVDNGDGVATLDFGSAATDGAAIHDNVAGEIAAIAEKANPAAADLLLIEDSADANNKKRVQISNLPKTRQQAILTFSGTLEIGGNPLRIYNTTGTAKTILQVHLSVATVPGGAAVIVDVHKNGTTIFTTQANRPQIGDGANVGISTTVENNVWAAGEYLTAGIDQIGSAAAGADLVVNILFE